MVATYVDASCHVLTGDRTRTKIVQGKERRTKHEEETKEDRRTSTPQDQGNGPNGPSRIEGGGATCSIRTVAPRIRRTNLGVDRLVAEEKWRDRRGWERNERRWEEKKGSQRDLELTVVPCRFDERIGTKPEGNTRSRTFPWLTLVVWTLNSPR